MAMTLVSTVTVGAGGAASIEFTNIAQTGKDLWLLISARSEKAAASDDYEIIINSDNSADYDRVQVIGTGSAVTTFKSSSAEDSILAGQINGDTSTASTFTNTSFYLSNYTSTANKSISVDHAREENATAAQIRMAGFRYINTTAVTTIKIQAYLAGSDLAQHSTASLYLVS